MIDPEKIGDPGAENLPCHELLSKYRGAFFHERRKAFGKFVSAETTGLRQRFHLQRFFQFDRRQPKLLLGDCKGERRHGGEGPRPFDGDFLRRALDHQFVCKTERNRFFRLDHLCIKQDLARLGPTGAAAYAECHSRESAQP